MINAYELPSGLIEIEDTNGASIRISFPEANALQADLRQILVDNAITMRDVL